MFMRLLAGRAAALAADAERLVRPEDARPGLCGQVAAALALRQPVADVIARTGDEPMTARQVVALLQRGGVTVRTIWGTAFQQYADLHRARYGGDAFRAVGFDTQANAGGGLGHAVYLEGQLYFEPSARTWHRATRADDARWEVVAVLVPRT